MCKILCRSSRLSCGVSSLTLAIYDSLRHRWIVSVGIQMMMLFSIQSSFIDARHTSVKLSVIVTNPHLLRAPQDLVDAPVCG